jgi:hypothetical protein
MSKNNVVRNNFVKGVNTDIAEEATTPDTLVGAHNMRLTSTKDKVGVVQKQASFVEVVNGYDQNLIPLAVKDYDNVIYFVSYNVGTHEVEIGTFPSADVSELAYEDTPIAVSAATIPMPTFDLNGTGGLIESSPIAYSIKVGNVAGVTNARLTGLSYASNSSTNFDYTSTSPQFPETLDKNSTVKVELLPSKDIRPFYNLNTQVRAAGLDIISGGRTYKFAFEDFYRRASFSLEGVGNLTTYFHFTTVGGASWDEFVIGNNPGPQFVADYGTTGTHTIGVSVDITLSNTALYDSDIDYDLSVGGIQTFTLSERHLELTLSVELVAVGIDQGFVIKAESLAYTGSQHVDFFLIRLVDGGSALPTFDYSTKIAASTNTALFSSTYSSYSSEDNIKLYLITTPADEDTASTRIKLSLTNPISPSTKLSITDTTDAHIQYETGSEFVYLYYTGAEKYPSGYTFNLTMQSSNSMDVLSISSSTFQKKRVTTNVGGKVYKYAPLPNYDTSDSGQYLDPFRTKAFGYNKDSEVDMELQPSYDGSMNIILASEGTKPRIVNSRMSFSKDEVEVIVRKGGNLDNVYTDKTIDKTYLIMPIGNDVPKLEYKGVKDGGHLEAGGYKYYFKLKTADGFETDVVEESRLVSIHIGKEFGKANSVLDNRILSKRVEFELTNIVSKSFKYVSVYYAKFSGITEPPAMTLFKIDADYEIKDKICKITHTGFENKLPVTADVLTAQLTPVTSVKTITQKNNRLLLGNVKTIKIADPDLAEAALYCYVDSSKRLLHTVKQKTSINPSNDDTTYANPDVIYNYTSYFEGETYEFALNFVFDTGTVSQAYPIMGYDFFLNIGNSFDKSLLGQDIGWIGSGQNSHGVVRIMDRRSQSNVNLTESSIDVYTISINTHELHINTELITRLKEKGVIGYFVSRRKRIPDMVMEGLITNTAVASLSSMSSLAMSVLMSRGDYIGYGEDNNSALGGKAYFPTPMNAVPLSTEALLAKNSDGDAGIDPKAANVYLDAILFGKVPPGINRKYALYSPDITSDTSRIASMDFNDAYGLMAVYKLESKSTSNGILFKTSYTQTGYTNDATILPYAVMTSELTSDIQAIRNLSGITYVDDAYRLFNDGGFTGLLDKQLAYTTYNSLKSRSVYGKYVDANDIYLLFLKQTQHIFLSALATELSDSSLNYCISGANYDWGEDYSVSGSAEQREESLEYVQLLMSGVAYSPYLGIEVKESWDLYDKLNPSSEIFTAYSHPTNNRLSSGYLGYITRLYKEPGPFGPMIPTDWRRVYEADNQSPYFAISKRFSIEHQLWYDSMKPSQKEDSKLVGGDCYTGFYFQRAWRPAGIEGVPNANNPLDYAYDADTPVRDGVKITSSGMAVGFPIRSKYNFAIRALMEADAYFDATGTQLSDLSIEEEMYKKGRTYCSSLPSVEDVMGNRQAETSMMNYGNMTENTIMFYNKVDKITPYS